MPKTYTTPVGETVTLHPGVLKDYLYCTGCGHGRKIQQKDSDRTANAHAASCHRTRSGKRRTPNANATHSRRSR
ncbi:hypothetical protein [Streptomyces indicus]|uniref:Uncharacterized protein n=1 Tax=Streptomyces indicus TaxID=417292 RepID=A0A1G9ITJ0_9ACTN|nr:hypothetical protein [Streptomyces indicus]SDL28243.1 hypothetical protein SAMN05421806_12549 [Streptomyces indicus]